METLRSANFFKKTLFLIGVFFLFLPKIALSEVRTSENYKIFADTLSSGGDYSTSTSYRLWDTIGEIASEENSTSTNFRARIGFQALIPDDILNVTLSGTDIDLGQLSTSDVKQGNLTITYSTNANGFTSTMSEDGNLRTSSGNDIDDVADGAVDAGTEEYGFRTSGTIATQNSADTSITSSAKNIAQASGPTPSDNITVTFKAAINGQTTGGTYSHVVTITTTGNF